MLTISSDILLSWGHLFLISCFHIYWSCKFNVSTIHALCTCRCSGWSFEETENLSNFDFTVSDFDIAFDMFNCFISAFSWSWFANLAVIKVASEPESSPSALISNVLKPLLIFTGNTWRNVILPVFWFCWLKVLLYLLVVVCCPGVARCGVSYQKGWPYISICIYSLLWHVSLKNNFYIVFALLQDLFFWLLTSF